MSDHRRLPGCCGSEDGDLAYGVDPGGTSDTMVEAWRCNTCGVVTITDVVVTVTVT